MCLVLAWHSSFPKLSSVSVPVRDLGESDINIELIGASFISPGLNLKTVPEPNPGTNRVFLNSQCNTGASEPKSL